MPGMRAPVRIRRVAAVERPVGMAFLGELRAADAADHAVELARLRQHQRERVLGAGDVGAAADGEHGHAAFGAGGGVDAGDAGAVFLHELAASARRQARRGRRPAPRPPAPARRRARRAIPPASRPFARGPGTGRPPARARARSSRRSRAPRARRNPRTRRSARPACRDRAPPAARAGSGRLRRRGGGGPARRCSVGWCGSGSICSAWPTRVCML